MLGVPVGRAFSASMAPVPPMLYLPLLNQPETMPARAGTWSSPIVVSPQDGSIWVVNPDAGSVSVIEQTSGPLPVFYKKSEINFGGEPWSVAIGDDGDRVYVADRLYGRILVIDAAAMTVVQTGAVAPELGSLLLSGDGSQLYVTSMTAASVFIVDAITLEIVAEIAVDGVPYALALTEQRGEGERLLVTHLFGFPVTGTVEAENDSRAGVVSVLDPEQERMAGTITIPPNEHGGPSMMASIAVQGEQAWLPHVRVSPALPNGMTTTTFAAVSTLDLTRESEWPAAALHLNDQDVFGSPVNNPAAVAPAPDGKRLYVVNGGSDLVEVVDVAAPTQPRLVKFMRAGKNPRGIAISADGRYGFGMNYLSRSVSVYDLARLEAIAEIPVTAETLSSTLLAGKIFFNNASDPRLSRGAWTSCASCHFEGWSDNVTWIFPDGPRQTPMLWNAADTLPWHWSAALDEPHDVEETILDIQHGLGLGATRDISLLGAPLAGSSEALDSLAAFLMEGIRPVYLPDAASREEQIAAGRELFEARGCQSCHGGTAWTISALPGPPGTLDADGDGMINSVLRDVGTFTDRDIRGEGGFDVPSLLGIGLTAPYFHDGSMQTLEELLSSGHPRRHFEETALSNTDIADLVAFLRTIGPDTEPVSTR